MGDFTVFRFYRFLLVLCRFYIGFTLFYLFLLVLSRFLFGYIIQRKIFQKVSLCVLTHPIGQNGRALCKSMVAMKMVGRH